MKKFSKLALGFLISIACLVQSDAVAASATGKEAEGKSSHELLQNQQLHLAVAYELPEGQRKLFGEMTEFLNKELGFVSPNNNPHVTVMHVRISQNVTQEEAVKHLKAVIEGLPVPTPWTIALDNSYVTSTGDAPYRWFDLNQKAKPEVAMQFNAKVAEALKGFKYRDGALERCSEPAVFNKMNPDGQAQVKNYGASGLNALGADGTLKMNHNPHFTLHYAPSLAAREIDAKKLEAVTKNFGEKFGARLPSVTFTNLIIGRLGYNGNIEEVLARIPLRASSASTATVQFSTTPAK